MKLEAEKNPILPPALTFKVVDGYVCYAFSAVLNMASDPTFLEATGLFRVKI